jgi:hypothetical protein
MRCRIVPREFAKAMPQLLAAMQALLEPVEAKSVC